MLASGVSLYRVAAPIILLSIGFSVLAVLDQELMMPRSQDKLLRKHEEVNQPTAGESNKFEMLRDQDNLVTFSSYDKARQQLKDVRILWRDEQGRVLRREMADVATWVAPEENKGDRGVPAGVGYWWLDGHARYIDDRTGRGGATPGSGGAGVAGAFPYSTGLGPKHIELYQSKRAVDFLSSAQVYELARNSSGATKWNLEKIMHTRFTGPVMNIIMLLLGIPFLLTREPGRLIKNMFACTVVSGVCFATTFVCLQMGGAYISPLLAAWLPVLVFGPVALAMLDTIKT
jgi:lipopolysaccharide export system permease protein